MAITVGELQSFVPDDAADPDAAALAVDTATALVSGYCRGNEVDRAGKSRPGIDAVTLTVAARIVANPGQVVMRDQAGVFSKHRGAGFSGFTLAELAVLNRYRRRAIGP